MSKPKTAQRTSLPRQQSPQHVITTQTLKTTQANPQTPGIRSLEEMLQMLTQPEKAAQIMRQQTVETSEVVTVESGPSYESATPYESLPSLESQLRSAESAEPIYEDLELETNAEEGHRLVAEAAEAAEVSPLHARALHKSHGLSTSTAHTNPSLAQQLFTNRGDLKRAMLYSIILDRPFE